MEPFVIRSIRRVPVDVVQHAEQTLQIWNGVRTDLAREFIEKYVATEQWYAVKIGGRIEEEEFSPNITGLIFEANIEYYPIQERTVELRVFNEYTLAELSITAVGELQRRFRVWAYNLKRKISRS